jgi:hypothetical protein
LSIWSLLVGVGVVVILGLQGFLLVLVVLAVIVLVQVWQ